MSEGKSAFNVSIIATAPLTTGGPNPPRGELDEAREVDLSVVVDRGAGERLDGGDEGRPARLAAAAVQLGAGHPLCLEVLLRGHDPAVVRRVDLVPAEPGDVHVGVARDRHAGGRAAVVRPRDLLSPERVQ